MGAVEVSLPRVSDVPPEVSSDGFHSEIVNRYQRRSRTQARLMARLYLEGLSSGDFEPVFRALVGETAALSPNSILKLKADWQQEYESWKKRPLRGRYVYLYADGVYLKAGVYFGESEHPFRLKPNGHSDAEQRSNQRRS